MRVHLPNCDLDLVARSHGWYDLPPFRYDEVQHRLDTAWQTESGTVFLQWTAGKKGTWASGTKSLSPSRLKTVSDRVLQRHVDLGSFHSLCAARASEGFGWIAARGAGHMLSSPTLFEDAVKVLLTTNCSWSLTKAMVTRLIELCGKERAFPVPEAITRLSEETLRKQARCGYRAPFLLRFARAAAEGTVDLAAWENPHLPDEDIEAAIRKNPGFGPYASQTLLRLLGRHQKLGLDSWSRKKVADLRFEGRQTSDPEIERFYSSFGKWAGLAFWLDVTRDWHTGQEAIWP